MSSLMDLDLNGEPNRQLKTLISTEDSEEVDDEIASQVILIAMKLKKKKVAKSKSTSSVSTSSNSDATETNSIKLKFDTHRTGNERYICLDFETRHTIYHVIDQLNIKRKVSRILCLSVIFF